MVDAVNAADIGLAVLRPNPTFRTVYPNKIFDYMACARPIVLAIDGIARDLVCKRSHAGVFAEPGDGGAMASAIRRLAEAALEPELRGSGRTIAQSPRPGAIVKRGARVRVTLAPSG